MTILNQKVIGDCRNTNQEKARRASWRKLQLREDHENCLEVSWKGGGIKAPDRGSSMRKSKKEHGPFGKKENSSLCLK